MSRQTKAERNAVEKNRRERNRALGLCLVCGGPRDTWKLNCSRCIERQRTSDAKRVARGMCKACGRPTKNGHQRCDYCKQQRRALGDKHAADGLCRCGRPRADGHKQCQHCIDRSRDKTMRLKMDAFNAYGGPVCACCGETIPEFLQLDHIENNGAEHRKRGLMGTALYQLLKAQGYPPGYQVLCANCNFAKGILGFCPHHPPVNSRQASMS